MNSARWQRRDDDQSKLYMEGDVGDCLERMQNSICKAFMPHQTETCWLHGEIMEVHVAGYDTMAQLYLTPGPVGRNINDFIAEVRIVQYFLLGRTLGGGDLKVESLVARRTIYLPNRTSNNACVACIFVPDRKIPTFACCFCWITTARTDTDTAYSVLCTIYIFTGTIIAAPSSNDMDCVRRRQSRSNVAIFIQH